MSILQEKLRLTKKSGFTLVETMVSLVLLSIAVIPIMYLSILILNSVATIQDNMIASNLIQEAFEAARGIRDDNWFNNRDFDTGLTSANHSPAKAVVDWDSPKLMLTSDPLIPNRGDSTRVYIKDGIYVQTKSGGTPTKFQRSVLTTPTSKYVKISVTISYPSRWNLVIFGFSFTIPHIIQADSYLYDWK
jgi:prepilin-type N-terminal cleavage/methylation domain-containing protein